VEIIGQLLDQHEAAKFLRLTVRTLERYRVDGTGPSFCRLGRRLVRYRQGDLDQWVERARRTSTSDKPQAKITFDPSSICLNERFRREGSVDRQIQCFNICQMAHSVGPSVHYRSGHESLPNCFMTKRRIHHIWERMFSTPI
jgi:predicted DNA-binding transcriptional regulator AlpA